jgi:tetratricopeptide (TPR) repeat protein
LAQAPADPTAPGAAESAASEPPAAEPAVSEPETKYPEVKEAAELFSKRDVEGALAKLKEAKAKYEKELPYAEQVMASWMWRIRDFSGAYEMCEAAAAAYPNLPPAAVQMAGLAAQMRARAAMQNYLERAVAENPTDPEAYVLLGGAAIAGNRVAEAELLLGQAQTLLANFSGDADRQKALQQRVYDGLAAVAQNRAGLFDSLYRSHRDAKKTEEANQARAKAKEWWGKARGHLENWLKLAPENVGAIYRLGTALFLLDQTQEAYTQFQKAHSLDPRPFTAPALNPSATMAGLYERAGAHEQAQKWMAHALKPDQGGNDLFTRLTAGEWALNTGDLPFAKQQADAALAIDSRDLRPKMLAGIVALWQKEWTTAESYFTDAMLLDPKRFEPKNNLALALCEQDDTAKKNRAVEYARQNAQAAQQNAQLATHALSTYGWVLFRAGNTRDADNVLKQLIQGRGGQGISPDTWYYYARVAFELGRKDEAKRVLENILKIKRPFSRRADAEALLQQIGN